MVLCLCVCVLVCVCVGHVESFEAGVFRNDLPVKFNLDATAMQELIDQLDETLHFALTVEANIDMDTVTNYHEVRDKIKTAIEGLRDNV